MASNTKDALKELMENQERARALDKKWRGRKPEKADFSLEGVDIGDLINGRKAHEASREKRAEEIKRSIPSEKSWSSISFGWEGWTMVVMCIAIFIYYKMVGVPSHTASVVVSILSFGIVGIYFVRALRAKNKRKKEIADLEEYRRKVLREPYADEDKYERAVAFAEALSDYEMWQEIKKPAHWKELSAADARREIFALYETKGLEPEGTYDEYVDFTLNEDGKLVAFSCPAGKRFTLKMAEVFLAEMQDDEADEGRIYAFGIVENAAVSYLQGENVKFLGLDDVLALVGSVDGE